MEERLDEPMKYLKGDLESPPNLVSRKLLYMLGVSFGLFWGLSEYGQDYVNKEHATMNHVIRVETMSTEEKIHQLIGTTAYASRNHERLNKATNILFGRQAPFVSSRPNSGLLHLYAPEMSSVENAKKYVEMVQSTVQIPYFISADIEGGAVRHLNLTVEDVRRFGIPEEILEIRERELNAFNEKTGDDLKITDKNRSPLPSQEWLGREYDQLQSSEDKIAFLQMMTAYGETIASICDYIGINVVFGPNLDMVYDIDGTRPEEYDDRSYGSNFETVSKLAIAYIDGFSEIPSVVSAPKHFVGNGTAQMDPHHHSTQVVVDRNKETCLLPFRDVIKSGMSSKEISRLQDVIDDLRDKNRHHLESKNNTNNKADKSRIQKTIDANNEIIHRYELKITTIYDEKKGGPEFIMTSNVSTNLYAEPDVPTMYSSKAISALTRSRVNRGFGFEGIVVTDDASMQSARDYISDIDFELDEGWRSTSIYVALSAGNDMVIVKNIADDVPEIVESVARHIDEQNFLDGDGEYEISEESLNESVRQVMDLKAQMGLIDRILINGEVYYALNPDFFDTSTDKVLRDSFFSNQWPWLSKSEYYEAQGREKPVFIWPKLSIKATKNFVLTLWRTRFGQVNPRFTEAENNPRKLIVIDKSIQHLFMYDFETGQFEGNFEVGIGKGTSYISGGDGPRRIIGDYQTPTGHYEVVGKRDDIWWRENKGVPFPDFYGGEDGGMIVLAGPWHPEIALHSSNEPELGKISNGCVRIPDEKKDLLLRELPLGSKVVITN